VEEPEIEINQAKKSLVITIRVGEGPQYRISTLTIGGNKLFPEGEIRRLMTLMPGGVFSRERLQATWSRSRTLLGTRVSLHRCGSGDRRPAQRHHVSVSMEIAEGSSLHQPDRDHRQLADAGQGHPERSLYGGGRRFQ